LLDDDTTQLFFLANSVILNTIVSGLGTVSNVISILIFVRQGFRDTVNISLFGLAFSDLLSLVSLLWLAILSNPLLKNSEQILFVALDVQYLTAGWPHVCFARVTGWITAFVTFERCLCICLPLKVKTILTPTRVNGCIVGIFLVVMASVAPTYYTSRLGDVFIAERNRTLVGLVVTPDRAQVESVAFTINNVVSPIGSFCVVVVCTIVLAVKLREKTKWRQSATRAKEQDRAGKISRKDQKAVKMVVAISTVFIVSFTPTTVFFAWMAHDPAFGAGGVYQNIFNVVFSFSFLLEAINGSVNIFVYYNMSSRYRNSFIRMFRFGSGSAVGK
ncbi:unnamed protein product, partial [Lymnaea stagnalis]